MPETNTLSKKREGRAVDSFKDPQNLTVVSQGNNANCNWRIDKQNPI
jgi:hypothetical protein